jgi:SPP1 gp7 family putative phage head morphogenesis protein
MPFVFKAKDDSKDNQPPLTPDEKEVVQIINSATSDLSDASVSSAVKAAISTGNIEQVVDTFPWEATAFTLSQTVSAFKRAIKGDIGKGFPKTGFVGRFDYTDPRSTEYALKQSAKLVTNMTGQMKDRVREVVGRAFTENITVVDTARELRSFINLTSRQEVTLSKFIDLNRARLMEEGLSGRKLENRLNELVDRQYKKMVSQRSKIIARNEILEAENAGRMLGFEQSIEQGWASPVSVKRWSTSTDERTCDICMPMNGMSVQWNQYFPNGVYDPPAHIMCRCSISLLEPDSPLAQNRMPTGVLQP